MRLFKALFMLPLLGAAASAQAAEPTASLARVEANSVFHPGEGVTVRVPQSAVHVGSERFNLYGVADAEVHVFVEPAADKRLRLYWIQFESYLPSKPELSYNYADGNRRVELWGTTTWLRSNPVPTTGPVRPGSDREHVIGILKRAGYAIPPEVMNVRMVQLLDDPQGTGKARRELMLIYSEDLALTGRTLAELTTDGKPNASWAAFERPLIERATNALKVERKAAGK
jgi:hypothetical protein